MGHREMMYINLFLIPYKIHAMTKKQTHPTRNEDDYKDVKPQYESEKEYVNMFDENELAEDENEEHPR